MSDDRESTIDSEPTRMSFLAELEVLRAETAAVARSEKLLRSIFDQIDDAIYVKNEESQYILINTAAARILGCSPAEAIGRDDTRFLPEDEARRVKQEDIALLDHGTPRVFREDRTVSNEVRSFLTTKSPQPDSQGRLIGVVGIMKDVTAQTRAEQALEESETFRAEIERIAHIGTWRLNYANEQVTWSHEHYRIHGLDPRQVRMTRELAVARVHPDDRADLMAEFGPQSLADRQTHERTCRVLHEDGSVRIVRIRGQCVVDQSGTPVSAFGTVQDITEQRNNEAVLEESLRRFQAIFDNTLDGLVLFDDVGHINGANPSICRLVGYDQEELLQLTIRDFARLAEADQFADLLGYLLERGSLGGEYSIVCKDGAIKEIEYHCVANILPGLHLAVGRDITERKRAREQIARKAHVLDVTHDSIMVRHWDGTIAFWNRGAESRYGWTREEVFGEVHHILLKTRFPEPLTEIEAKLLSTGGWEGELTHTRRDGSRVVVASRWVLDRDDQGLVRSVLVTENDLTERKEIEEALKSQEFLLADAQERGHVGSWSWDIPGNLATGSDETHRLFGLDPESGPLSFEEVFDCVHPDDRATFRDAIERAVESHEPYESFFRVVHGDGTVRDMHSLGQIVFGDDGRPVRLFGTTQDITELLRAERALQASERRFRAIFEGALDAMTLADDQGRYVDVNPAACALFGLPPSAMIGRACAEFALPGSELDADLGEIAKASGEIGYFRLVRPDRSLRDIEYVADAEVLPGRHFCVLRDVTDRRQAVAALRRYAERLAILRQIDRAILAAGSPDKSAQAALERLGRIVSTWRSSVTLFDFDARMALVYATTGAERERVPTGTLTPLDQFERPVIATLEQNREYIVEDVEETGPLTGPVAGFPYESIRSYARVPLMCEGHLLGSLNLYWDQPHALDREQMDVAREVADSLATAIWHIRLLDEARSAREHLSHLSRRLLRAEENERRRIAGELHDEIGQALTALRLNLKTALRDGLPRALEDSVELVDRTIEQVRTLSVALRPALLDDLGLVPALRSLVNGFARRSGIEHSFVAPDDFGRHDPEIETACYRTAQEALTNCSRHSQAGHVRVQVTRAENDLLLTVDDDGRGFDVHAAQTRARAGSSLGLLGMNERAGYVGGHVEITSAPGRGTTIRGRFPLAAVAFKDMGVVS